LLKKKEQKIANNKVNLEKTNLTPDDSVLINAKYPTLAVKKFQEEGKDNLRCEAVQKEDTENPEVKIVQEEDTEKPVKSIIQEERREMSELREHLVKKVDLVESHYSVYLFVFDHLENWSVVGCDGKQDWKHRCKLKREGLLSEERLKLVCGCEVALVQCYLAAWVS